ncbi:hypothetical protein PoB_004222000, partial [Plakobranchus ocellatus]
SLLSRVRATPPPAPWPWPLVFVYSQFTTNQTLVLCKDGCGGTMGIRSAPRSAGNFVSSQPLIEAWPRDDNRAKRRGKFNSKLSEMGMGHGGHGMGESAFLYRR